MIIDMVSEHASPLAVLGGADAGGQNVHVAALAAALADRGHRVTVHTRRDQESLPDRVRLCPGVTVEHVAAGPPRPLAKDDLLPHMAEFGLRLTRRWARERPDIVHAHFWMSGLAALPGTRAHGIPLAQTFHALGSVKRRYQGDADTSPAERIELEARAAREAQVVIATCSDEVRELCAYGVPPDSAAVVPSGVDLTHFRPRGPAAQRGDLRRVLSIGRLVPRKGTDTLIEALAEVPDTELVIAGGPGLPDLDADPEVRRLRAIAESRGVAGRVAFTGRVPHEEAASLMRSADVVATVPWYEPFGIVPLEAMACGVPVLGTAVGGHLDTIDEGVTGLLVEPRDPHAVALRLKELLDDPAWRAALGRAGVRRARNRYSWPRIAAKTEAVYARLAAPALMTVQGGRA